MKSFVVNYLTVLNISGCEIRLDYIIFSSRSTLKIGIIINFSGMFTSQNGGILLVLPILGGLQCIGFLIP